MDTRLLLDTFFNVTLARNGLLEALGNRLMRPWKHTYAFTWYDVNAKRIAKCLPEHVVNIISDTVKIAIGVFGYAYSVWKFSHLAEKQPSRHTALALGGLAASIPVMMVLGTLIKIVSWLIPSVRAKNLQYMQLKKEEQTSLTYFIPQTALEKKVNFDQRTLNPQDRLSPLPIVLKQLIFEFLSTNQITKLKEISKTQCYDITQSAEHLNRNLIKKVFPPLLLRHLGMEKIVQLMSQPSLKQKLAPEDLIKFKKIKPGGAAAPGWVGKFSIDVFREMEGAPPIGCGKVWHFNPLAMKNQTIGWGKTSEGKIYLAISYKYHAAPVVFDHMLTDLKYAGKEGISIFTFVKENENQWKIEVTPVFEKRGPRYDNESFHYTYQKVNCFVVNENILSIEDYLPRLLKGEPCGVVLKDELGHLVEGPKHFQNRSMVELVPIN